MAYFLTDDNSTKGRDPNINIINGIHKIKGKTSVSILVSNYTNKHINFNKREYVGHFEPTLMDNTTINQSEVHSTNSIRLQEIIAEQVKSDTFDPPHHKLKTSMQEKLDTLLVEFETQFAKDETSIRTTLLTKITINTGNSYPVPRKSYPITIKIINGWKRKLKSYSQPRSSAAAYPVGQHL